ncbi:uncharacterized protein LOC142982256 isoform X2 [Anticarsia gemmatalis]|uniref:uncharacterized protein LOC142982256 isoform X2 n=1 Tax=Anticarsia gemmatalis TaxID=129554 RepID=UPI003F77676A
MTHGLLRAGCACANHFPCSPCELVAYCDLVRLKSNLFLNEQRFEFERFKMEIKKVCYIWTLLSLLLFDCLMEGSTEETSFELPVQLVGFPFIIMAVRLTNFVKKLSYALSPATYRSRNRRELTLEPEPFDVTEVEKYIVGEFGARACVFERVCAHYATRAQAQPRQQLDWPDVFSQYKRSPDQAKEFYLLSVFLGDIVGSPQLCHQLGKRRSCDTMQFGVA